LLMRLSLAGAVRAHWTREIHDEWICSLLEKRPDLTRAQLERRADLMDRAIPGASVEGHTRLIRKLRLPDPDDRHVLAAAIKVSAARIVTHNTRDFPRASLAPFGIRAQRPDSFVIDLSATFGERVVEAARRQRAGLRNPAISVDEMLESYARNGLTRTAEWLAQFADDL
ncbi:MAG: PIN domain-containing protein, partial [Longimicrobiales bacterium]